MEEDSVHKYVDRYWVENMKIKTAMGQVRFTTLVQVMVAVLSLSYNNIDYERAFSIVLIVHTECRQTLNTNTLTALLQCKLAKDRSRYEFNVTMRRWCLQQNVPRTNHGNSRDQCEYLIVTLYTNKYRTN